MILQEFINQNNGQFVDVDKAYGAQCWDLTELYAEQVLGVPKEPWAITLGPNGSAREAWTVFDSHMQKYFDKIPKGQEKTGDITIYDGHGVYTDGHIAIKVDGGVFEQNADPDHSPAHIATRADTYLLGSLRVKEIQVYPNQGDLTNAYNDTGWPGHPPNQNDVAYWCNGTGNKSWGNSPQVWKDLTYTINGYVRDHATKQYKPYTGTLYTQA